MSAARYEGKPLLRLLECYVLRAVGELPEADARRLEALAPLLQQTYSMTGERWEILASVMHFPPHREAQFHRLWEHNRGLAARAGEELQPDDFARMVVDANFAS